MTYLDNYIVTCIFPCISFFAYQWLSSPTGPMLRHSYLTHAAFQRQFFSSASPETKDKESSQSVDRDTESANKDGGAAASEQTQDAGFSTESKRPEPHSTKKRRRRSTKRTQFSDSDSELDLSADDLVELVKEKEELLKLKQKEIEKMQDKVLHSYAEMENVLERTKREAENTKKFSIQVHHTSLFILECYMCWAYAPA